LDRDAQSAKTGHGSASTGYSGRFSTQQFLEREYQQWVDSLSHLTQDQSTAILLSHLFQGAILDFLTTGNAQRGQQTIQSFAEALR
jgi:hypothetical protein